MNKRVLLVIKIFVFFGKEIGRSFKSVNVIIDLVYKSFMIKVGLEINFWFYIIFGFIIFFIYIYRSFVGLFMF